MRILMEAIRAWLQARRETLWDREHAEGYRRQPEDVELTSSLARFAAESTPPYEA